MGYKSASKIRIDLSELGDNNGVPFYVEIKNPKLITLGDREQFKKFGDTNTDRTETGMTYFKSMIVSWNLIDTETEEPILLSDPDAVYKIPVEVFTKISAVINPPKEDEAEKN